MNYKENVSTSIEAARKRDKRAREMREKEAREKEARLEQKYAADMAQLLASTALDINGIVALAQAFVYNRNLIVYGEDYYDDQEEYPDSKNTRDVLLGSLSELLDDTHRCEIVSYHAQGLSTTAAVKELIVSDEVLTRLSHPDAIGLQALIDSLVHRFSYLRPGNPRFSEAKYGQVWRDARTAHKAALRDMPLMSIQEQVALLCRDIQQTRDLLADEDREFSAKEYALLKTTLRQSLVSLQKLTRGETGTVVERLPPQLLTIIESVVVGLDTRPQFVLTEQAEQQLVNVLGNILSDLQSKDVVETPALPHPDATPADNSEA